MFIPLSGIIIAVCIWYFVAKKHEERIEELESALLHDDEPNDEELR